MCQGLCHCFPRTLHPSHIVWSPLSRCGRLVPELPSGSPLDLKCAASAGNPQTFAINLKSHLSQCDSQQGVHVAKTEGKENICQEVGMCSVCRAQIPGCGACGYRRPAMPQVKPTRGCVHTTDYYSTLRWNRLSATPGNALHRKDPWEKKTSPKGSCIRHSQNR